MIFARRRMRALATVMFTDIVGSTEHAGELGDRRWRNLLAAHHALVRRQLHHFHGHEVDTSGDGFFATFDQPEDAVRCAGAIVAGVRSLGIEVRAGVHTGEAEVIGKKVGGIAVHVAVRVMEAAGPSEVLVSSTVRDLVAGSRLEFENAGTHRLKGIPEAWHLWRLKGTVDVEKTEVPATPAEGGAAPGPRRRVLALGLLGAVGLTVVVAALALAPATQSGPPPGPDTVVSYDRGFRPLTVARINDPERLAFDGTYLWVSSPEGGLLTRLNPADPADVLPLAHRGTALAAAESGLWVADRFSERLIRIEPVTATLSFGPADFLIEDLAVGFGSVWGTDDRADRVLRFDLSSPESPTPITLANRSLPSAIESGTDGIWVALTAAPPSLIKIDPTTNLVERGSSLRSTPTAVAVGDGLVWVASSESDELYLVQGDQRDTLPVCDSPSALAADGATVWVACRNGRAVWHVDADRSVLGRYPVPGVPTDILVLGDVIWVALRAS